MKRHTIVAGAAALALGLTRMAHAAPPCELAAGQEYIHPAKASKLTGALVQAYVTCNSPGARIANSETETGTASCYPAETWAHFNNNGTLPFGTWTWGPKSQGSVSFKAGKNKITTGETAALSDEEKANARDLFITLKMSDIRDEEGVLINEGSPALFSSFVRTTLIDRAESKVMTMFDFPLFFYFQAVGGSVKVKTSATERMDVLGWPALPRCATIEFVDTFIRDPNGNTFAHLGAFLQ
jgi:hypothetical protein